MIRRSIRGFTLIELLVALAIAVILMLLAAPNYTAWVADAQVRAGAESLASGLRFAMAEAIKRNAPVEFVLDPTTGSGGWVVQDVGGGTQYQSAPFGEGSGRVAFTVTPLGSTTITFDGLGQIATTNADASFPFTAVDLQVAGGSTKNLRVLVGGTRTGVKICDPYFPVTDPKGCPNLGG
jgi:type IV fimbrial biogenesis protein FimT